MNIVVIDDDKLVALSLKTILESTGKINVLAMGEKGEQAVTLYDTYKPDVMLMDIRMTGMTGLEAGEQVLQKDKNAKWTIVNKVDRKKSKKCFKLNGR